MTTESIKIRHTWQMMLPFMLLISREGSDEAREEIRLEFDRMALAADRGNLVIRAISLADTEANNAEEWQSMVNGYLAEHGS